MRETLFIRRNKDRWEEFNVDMSVDPDELTESYVQVLDDLAYAQTFYPRSKTEQYLNEKAVGFYNKIYSKRKERISTLFNFFRVDLPVAVRENHRQLLYAVCFFTVFVFVGIVSAAYESDFLSLILGKGYVEMTKDNIQRGDPFGVYTDSNYLLMFVRIALNNILITILMIYASGLLLSIGTLYSLMFNGIMLGSFQYFFFHYGWGWQSILVIWIHGALEISAVVIAGGAGLTLGNSLLFPGSLTRLQSLQKGAERSAKILVMTVLMLIVAAWFESHVTHLSGSYFASNGKHAGLHPLFSLSILIGSISFIVWYFIFYPLTVERRMKSTIAA